MSGFSPCARALAREEQAALKNSKAMFPLFRHPVKPNHNRRCHGHDYTALHSYLVTISKHPAASPFSSILNSPDPHAHQESIYKSRALSAYASSEKGAIVPEVRFSMIGQFIDRSVRQIAARFPQVEIRRYAIMPDHLHLVVIVREVLPEPGLALVIREFKGAVTALYQETEEYALREEAITDLTLSRKERRRRLSVWSEGFNDRIASGEGCVARFVRYVVDNPLRYLIKRLYPEYFRRVMDFTIGDEYFTLYGNLLLLRYPQKIQVRFSSKFTCDEWEDRKRQIRRVIRNEGAVVSPFIHPEEKALRDEAMKEGASVILIVADGLPDRFQPKSEYADLCAEGRLLIVAPGIYHSRKPALKRNRCMEMNALAKKIAALDAEPMQLRPSLRPAPE